MSPEAIDLIRKLLQPDVEAEPALGWTRCSTSIDVGDAWEMVSEHVPVAETHVSLDKYVLLTASNINHSRSGSVAAFFSASIFSQAQ